MISNRLSPLRSISLKTAACAGGGLMILVGDISPLLSSTIFSSDVTLDIKYEPVL